jgi:NAD(P)H-dependent FMN reductase
MNFYKNNYPGIHKNALDYARLEKSPTSGEINPNDRKVAMMLSRLLTVARIHVGGMQSLQNNMLAGGKISEANKNVLAKIKSFNDAVAQDLNDIENIIKSNEGLE